MWVKKMKQERKIGGLKRKKKERQGYTIRLRFARVRTRTKAEHTKHFIHVFPDDSDSNGA